MPPLQVVFSLGGILLIIVAAYYVTYYLGLKVSGQKQGKNFGTQRKINLMERFAVSKDKSFYLVQLAGKIYFIGFTNASVTLIDTLEVSEFEEYYGKNTVKKAANPPAGVQYGGKLTNKLASMIASGIGKTKAAALRNDSEGETFADSMKKAQNTDISGKPERTCRDRPDSTEEK